MLYSVRSPLNPPEPLKFFCNLFKFGIIFVFNRRNPQLGHLAS